MENIPLPPPVWKKQQLFVCERVVMKVEMKHRRRLTCLVLASWMLGYETHHYVLPWVAKMEMLVNRNNTKVPGERVLICCIP